MSCRRAFEIDLAGFLEDARREEFAGFRDHYPRCPECAAEVRAWTELDALLGTGAPAHPEPELLLRYEEDPGRLEPGERTRVSAHLERCASCRDELAALRDFAPGRLAEPAPAAGEPGRRGLLAAIGRIAWHPAFAYAVLVLVAGPAVYSLMRPGGAEYEAPSLFSTERSAIEGIMQQSGEPKEDLAAVMRDEPRSDAPAVREKARAEAEIAEDRVAPAPEEAGKKPAEAAKRAVPASEPARRQAAVDPQPAPTAPPPTRTAPSIAAEQEEALSAVARKLEGDEPSAAAPPAPDSRARAEAADAESPREVEMGVLEMQQNIGLGYVVEDRDDDAGGRAAGSVAQEAYRAPSPPPLRFESEPGGMALLRIPDPGSWPIEVRLVSPDGRREIVQRFEVAPAELRVHPSWIEPGAHRVIVVAPTGVVRLRALR